ncbi:plasmid recombination protein, partial [Lactobacillus gasseri]|nr:plasmid recombination protein [Lactobacillus gasseri]RGL13023.1 hypothetical protein DXC77_09880 [Lactobacillus gasseri]
MPEMTMSFAKGKANETSIKHNNRSLNPREFDFNKTGHKHIKPEYTELNEVLVHDNIRDVYKREFGQAVKDYNSKQKRKDRRIKDYYSKVKNSKKLRTQYEFIVQVGNIDDYKHDKNRKTSQIWQDSKEILENYFENFQERNPNLIPYNAVIHMDEEGAPHMHLNVVPVAHDYNAKQGLKVKPVLNKALAEEGFEISKKDNRQQWTDFQHAEAQALADEAWIYGITRKAGITNRLKDVHQYKQAMREVEDLRKQKKQVEHQLWDKRDQIDSLDRRERDYQTRSLRLQDRALELDDREDKLNQREEVLKKRERANAELDAERMAGKYREKNIAWAFMPFSRTRLSEVEKENAELRRKNKEQQKKLDTQDGMIDRYWAVANAAIKTIRLVARKLPKYAKSIWHKLGEEIQDIGGDKKFFGLEEDEKNLVNEGFDRKSREEQRKSKEELREMYRNLQDGRDL